MSFEVEDETIVSRPSHRTSKTGRVNILGRRRGTLLIEICPLV